MQNQITLIKCIDSWSEWTYCYIFRLFFCNIKMFKALNFGG